MEVTNDRLIFKNNQNKKILVIENDPAQIFNLQKYFHIQGYHNVITARNGKNGVDLFTSNIDLIFLDIELSDFSSIDLCRHFKKLSPNKSMPVVGMAYKNEFKNLCISAGMDDFLIKPISSNDLEIVLNRWIQKTDFSLNKRS